MAEQSPRSIVNIVFVVLLAVVFAGACYGAYEMIADALTGPG